MASLHAKAISAEGVAVCLGTMNNSNNYNDHRQGLAKLSSSAFHLLISAFTFTSLRKPGSGKTSGFNHSAYCLW
jgi:hypothetical protein